MNRKIFFFLTLTFFGVIAAAPTRAATLFFSPASKTLSPKETFDVSVRVDSQGQGFNAAQAVIQYPKDILILNAVHSTGADSTFNFWLEGPDASPERGTVSFIGGTTNGVVGASIPILRMTFTVIGSGNGTITASDAAVTASDGSGTNILSSIHPAQISAQPTTVTGPAPSIQPSPQIPKEILQEITRPPVPSTRIPGIPAVRVPAYPDPERWYSATTDFLGQWDVSEDISGVSFVLDQNKNTVPPQKRDGLVAGKIFPALSDGIWYLHVRFQNNQGWGPTAHYRIAIDTAPPLPFMISVAEGASTDFPSPTIHFQTNDGLSGVNHYTIAADIIGSIVTEKDAIILPLLPPGIHTIVVRAEDHAGNSTESTVELEILPIPSPAITSVSRLVLLGEGGLRVHGTSEVTTTILLSLKKKSGETVLKKTVAVNALGNWETTIDDLLQYGDYVLEAVAQDPRGAMSLAVTSPTIRVRERPLLTLYGVNISKAQFFAGLALLLLGSIALGWMANRRWSAQAGRKAMLVERDVANLIAIMKKDIEVALGKCADGPIEPQEAQEIKFFLKKTQEKIEKIERYVLGEIKDIAN